MITIWQNTFSDFFSSDGTVTYLAKPDVDKDPATSLAKQTAYNVSKLLDSLLKDYDNSLRPDFGGND